MMTPVAAWAKGDPAMSAHASSHPIWFARPYPYVVLDQDVRGLLTEFGRNIDVPVLISSGVRGRVKGPLGAADAGGFLGKIAAARRLNWYFDGVVLHVSADTEFSTRLLDAGPGGAARVQREMLALGMADDRYPVRASRDGSIISVSGPPAYVSAVERLAERMQHTAVTLVATPSKAAAPVHRSDGGGAHVRIFRGGRPLEIQAVPRAG